MTHESTGAFHPREAALYTFVRTRDVTVLDELELPETVRSDVIAGAEAIADGQYETAIDRLEGAIDDVEGTDGTVSLRTLAALAHFHAGDEEATMSLAEEALHLHTDAWTALLVSIPAGDARPDRFRDGAADNALYFRGVVDTPGESDVAVSVGYSGDADGAVEWVDAPDGVECYPLSRLTPEIRVRLTLTGTVSAFPTLHGYHLSVGTIDRTTGDAETADKVLLSGPFSEGVRETIRIERDE